MTPHSALLIALSLTGAVAAPNDNLLTNPRFEQGLAGWNASQSWYEAKVDGKGTGLSEVTVVPGAGHDGGPALQMVGQGNRGIALQVFPVAALRLKVSGWLKCENLGNASADVLVEFVAEGGKWLSGTGLGGVTDTRDWTRLEKEIEVPAEAESIHFDLLTNSPNNGTVWWSDLSMTAAVEPNSQPPHLTFTAQPAPGEEGAVLVKWLADDPTKLLRVWVLCEPKPFQKVGRLMPAVQVSRHKTEAVVGGLEVGKTYHVAAVGLGPAGTYAEAAKPVSVTAQDLQAPVPPPMWIAPPLRGTGVVLHWRPTLLDDDVTSYELGIKWPDQQPLWVKPPPGAFSTQVDAGAGQTVELAVAATDRMGNKSEPKWLKVTGMAAPTGPLHGLGLWTTFSTAQIFPDATRPEGAGEELRLAGLRGQAASGQIALVSSVAREGMVLIPGRLKQPQGKGLIAAETVRWNPVETVHLVKQSTATPPEELIRKAPADFPDPLGDPSPFRLEPGKAQSIFVTVDIPRTAAPGTYEGVLTLANAGGKREVPVKLEVYPVELPTSTRLLVTTWVDSNGIARAAKAEPGSETHWRYLKAMMRDMHAHHQNILMIGSSAPCLQEDDGSFTFDWRELDRWVRAMDRCGVGTRIELSHLGGRKTGAWEDKEFAFNQYTAQRRHGGTAVPLPVPVLVKALRDHLAERGWLKRAMLHIADEPIPVNVESWKEHSRIAHEVAPDLRRIDAIHVTDLTGDLEVWVPQLNYFWQAHEQLQRLQREGKCELWFYVAWVPQGKFPNRLIDFPTIKTRLMHWASYKWDAVGYLHWGYNYGWLDPQENQFAPGDGNLVWPGQYGPRSSLRWEAQRQGIEDYELFCLLEDAYRKAGRADAKDAVKALLEPVIRTPEDYSKDPGELEKVRRKVVGEIVKLRG